MSSPVPLKGLDLIDCARANAAEGIAVAARQCGYGEDTVTFERALQQAGEEIGVEIQTFQDIGMENDRPSRNVID
jgi:hypothetical protein